MDTEYQAWELTADSLDTKTQTPVDDGRAIVWLRSFDFRTRLSWSEGANSVGSAMSYKRISWDLPNTHCSLLPSPRMIFKKWLPWQLYTCRTSGRG